MTILKKLTAAETNQMTNSNEYSVTDGKKAFLHLVRQVKQNGEECVFTLHGKPVARLVPIANSAREEMAEVIEEASATPDYHQIAVEQLEPLLDELKFTAGDLLDVAQDLEAKAVAAEKAAARPEAKEQERRDARDEFLQQLQSAVDSLGLAGTSLDAWFGY